MTAPIQLKCPENFRRHAKKVLAGEYDVPYGHPAAVILDVGANIGSFAVWAARRWPGCEIHCYEPVAENFALLAENVSALGARVRLNRFAIGDPSHREVFLGKNNCGECSFFQLGEQSEQTVAVETRPPSTMPPAHILKMDTEGAELEILAGLAQIDYDLILMEFHSERNRREVDRLLADYVLVGADVSRPDRGVLKYMHSRMLTGATKT